MTECGPNNNHRTRQRRSAKWGSEYEYEDNSVWYGQEKKLWVNIVVCVRVSSPPSFFDTYASFDL